MRASFQAAASEFIDQREVGFGKVPEDVRCERVDAGGVAAEWITPPNAKEGRVMLYFHGGGYTVGDVDTHRDLIARLARAAGVRALGVDYRLAPEHPFPAALNKKTSRDNPRQKKQKAIGKPIIMVATKEQKKRLKQNQNQAIAV